MPTRVYYFDERVESINRKLSYYLDSDNKRNSKADLKHIVSDSKFQQAVEEARNTLGLGEDYLEYEEELEDWIISKLAGKDIALVSKEENQRVSQKFLDVTVRAIEAANLSHGWVDFMRSYIALGKEPENVTIVSDPLIEVLEISAANNQLIISLEKGLKPEDYKRAWIAFKEFLYEPSSFRPTEDNLKTKIYLDYQRGWKPSELAKKYFLFEYQQDKIAARDKVKKIISRYKTPEKSGDKKPQ